MALLDALRALEEQIKQGRPEPEEKPTALPMQAIREMPEVFQQRDCPEWQSKGHIQELHRVPKDGRTLDPVTVFWIGSGWALVDGHHRLGAYRLARWRKEIPVQVLSGKTLAEARLFAGLTNGKASLAMTSAEKSQFAWRMRVTSDLSKARIQKASGMSDGWMGECQRVFKALREDKGLPLDELAEMRWHDARRRARGEAEEETDWESEEEREAQEWAAKLLKICGKRGHQRHHVLARALEIYDPRLPNTLRQLWDEELGEFSAEEAEEDADF
jgi:hypothetical protein